MARYGWHSPHMDHMDTNTLSLKTMTHHVKTSTKKGSWKSHCKLKVLSGEGDPRTTQCLCKRKHVIGRPRRPHSLQEIRKGMRNMFFSPGSTSAGQESAWTGMPKYSMWRGANHSYVRHGNKRMLICTPVLLPNAAQITWVAAWAGKANAGVFMALSPSPAAKWAEQRFRDWITRP